MSAENGNDNSYSNQYYIYPGAKQGESKIKYEFGLDEGSYSLWISGNNSGYFDGKQISDTPLYFDTTNKSYTDINMSYEDSQENIQYKTLDISLQFQEAVTESKKYSVVLYDEAGEHIGGSEIRLLEGSMSGSCRMSYNDKKYNTIYVGYCDSTGTSALRVSTKNKYFYSKENGVVGSFDKATPITSDVSSVTISEPTSYKITGSYTISTSSNASRYAYVMAEFENGETFYSRITIPSKTTSGSYIIRVPQRLRGEKFSIIYGMAGNADYIDKEYMHSDSNTLNGNLANIDVSFTSESNNDTSDFKGKIILPVAAPQYGLVVLLKSNYYGGNGKRIFIPEGTTEIEYELENVTASNGEYGIDAKIEGNCPNNISKSTSIRINANESSKDNIDLYFGETVKISGRVSLPNNMKADNYISFCIGDYNSKRYFTIEPMTNSIDYTIYAEKDTTLSDLYIEDVCSASENIYDGRIYYSADGGTLEYNRLNIQLSNDIGDMNFNLMECFMLSGTINLPDDVYYSKNLQLDLYAKNQENQMINI